MLDKANLAASPLQSAATGQILQPVPDYCESQMTTDVTVFP